MKQYDTIVIGAGVAGMTAAIYLKRAGLKVLLLEKNVPGGQVNQTATVENYPGFTSISGPDLAINIFEQVQQLNIPYEYGNVLQVTVEENFKKIVTDQTTYDTKTVLIATGRTPNKLNLTNENELIGKGVSFCALCDGAFYKDKVVGVIGSGNSALEEAIYLSGICRNVIMINRKDKYKGSPLLLEKLEKKDNIQFLYHCVIETLNDKDHQLSSIHVKQDDELKEIKLDGLFIYIGSHPETSFLNHLDLAMEEGYLIVDSELKTNIEGIYACGDVIKKDVYQIATAVGEGAIAATQIQLYLGSKE